MSSCRLLVRRRTNGGAGALEIELDVEAEADAEVDVDPYGEVYAETECKMD